MDLNTKLLSLAKVFDIGCKDADEKLTQVVSLESNSGRGRIPYTPCLVKKRAITAKGGCSVLYQPISCNGTGSKWMTTLCLSENLKPTQSARPLLGRKSMVVDKFKPNKTKDILERVQVDGSIAFALCNAGAVINFIEGFRDIESHFKYHSFRGYILGKRERNWSAPAILVVKFQDVREINPIYNDRRVNGMGVHLCLTEQRCLVDESWHDPAIEAFMVLSEFPDNVTTIDGQEIFSSNKMDGAILGEILNVHKRSLVQTSEKKKEKTIVKPKSREDREKPPVVPPSRMSYREFMEMQKGSTKRREDEEGYTEGAKGLDPFAKYSKQCFEDMENTAKRGLKREKMEKVMYDMSLVSKLTTKLHKQ
jgi:hypothetical protein